ncbi:DNA-processing protein DprA [Sphingomonas sp. MG17]|uniref:DNA-processing protein DprA n=1 Tax=Sphingomonas tagetis TaxID=2949092 RepID=A0A9X2HLK9_9SPHN|nr:DNA-processing protein DprA [Sphingomonas tagetis]MCP3732377.1 DNA-processing protein DprA [Sphingomonas tagetis]
MAEAEDTVARLRLIRSPRIGPVTYRQLIARFGSAEAALDALPALAGRGGGAAPAIADAGSVRREMAAAAKLGAHYLFLGDTHYPPLLAELENAPAAMLVRGDPALTRRTCVAMVGARNASAAACRFARQIAQGLASEGVTVVSGLARGIDTAAHLGSIGEATVGVIASGIDIAFPPENRDLQERVATEGLLIAEQPPGTEPLARHFPSRNRIIAGLAQGTVVVEAAPRSGSLITARIAAEAGREVMAVPGSPLDPRAQGCNLLIREGATLIQNVEDILEAIRPIDARAVRAPATPYAGEPGGEPGMSERRRVEGLLGPVPVAVDELIRQAELPAAMVQLVLLELELGGRLERHAGGRVSLA